ncbi:nucleoporin Nup186/Nup192/Nup205 [Jimgerdemannia flammicorona]|uniref:Nucleoporin Nup186/Nup192/Nup205 n=1 Tax=Jimgerdemannia flammicorona TaxID=994334 RepID=A0A433QUB5_9FUNG|nr:nucleoporin Nup186/Nup192/Nup205 [Jimgerdemannia flammicorona]
MAEVIWHPQAEALHNFICDAYTSTSPSMAKELQQELERFKPRFLTLLDDPPRNADHRAELQRGTVKINKVQHRVNEGFIHETKLLSDNLDIDEYLAATLLQYGTQQRSRFDRPACETAILLYHSERGYFLNCIDLIVKGAANDSVRNDIRSVFERFASDLVEAVVPLGRGSAVGNGTFAQKIMKTIENLKAQITSLTESGALESAIATAAAAAAPNAGGRPGRLGDDITKDRIRRLKEERKELAHILFHISYNRQLAANEIVMLAEMLRRADLTDVVTIYYLVALLASIDSVPEHALAGSAAPARHDSLALNKSFLNRFNALITQPDWSVPALRAVITLQWTMFLVFALSKRPSLQEELHFKYDRIEQMVEVSVMSDAFQFATHYVLGFRETESERTLIESLTFLTAAPPTTNGNAPTANGTAAPSPAEITKVRLEVDPDFHWYIIHQFELFVTSFIAKFAAYLKRTKNREEDAVFSQHPSRPALAGAAANTTPRRDLESFFLLISTLYQDRPNAGLSFWEDPEGRLFGFLRWAIDVRVPSMVHALFDMLGSLATGNLCAQHTYDFLNTNGGQRTLQPTTGHHHVVSWTALFSALDFYSTGLKNAPPVAPPAAQAPEIPPDEIKLLRSFLRLLRQVVKYSPTARMTLYENQQYRVMFMLFNLLGCAIPVDLKAALFDTIAAFCAPSGIAGNIGAELAKSVWVVLEQAQVLTTVKGSVQQLQYTQQTQLGGAPVQQQREEAQGILFELQEIESANETYPETLAFVNLLNTLVHVPSKNAALRSGFGVGSPSIPENLGAGYRPPGGIIPYVSFVIDHVLLKANTRGYLHPAEKWRVIETSLKLVEKCLIAYDLSGLTIDASVANIAAPQQPTAAGAAAVASVSSGTQSLLSYYVHPGFEIMCRLLCGSKLLDEVFRIIGLGVDAVNENSMNTAFFRKAVLRCLRIVSRVIHIQEVFLDILIPGITDNPGLVAPAKPSLPPSLVQIDQLLLYRQTVVIQIALFVNCTDGEEICLLAVKILAALAESPYFNGTERLVGGGRINRLVGMLDASDESLRISYGFFERLEVDEPEKGTSQYNEQDTDTIPLLLENPGAEDLDVGQPGMANSVRLAILQILLDNVSGTKVPPTIAHFLLGYSLRGNISQTEIKDPTSTDANMSCLHVILDLLREGIRKDDDLDIDGARVSHGVPLFVKHPTLAERCFHLIYKLCSDANTSSPTMRYLRNREDFFHRQFKAMPVRLDRRDNGLGGEIIGADGVKSTVDYASLLAQLHQRAWLMKTVALELHLTTNAGQRSHTQRLLELMFSTTETDQPGDEDDSEMDAGESDVGNTYGKSKFQQPLMKMLEVLNSLNFVWKDSFGREEIDLYYFAGISLEAYLRVNERLCHVYDIRAIYAFLLSWQNQLEKQGAITTVGHRNIIKGEIKRILQHCIAENHTRELIHAQIHCLEAWKQVVEITLAKCFDLLATEVRESILYNLISALLPKINDEAAHVVMAESLSSVVLSLMTKLRQDRHRQAVLQAAVVSDDSAALRLPTDRLHVIFKGLIEGIQRPGTSVSMRGNLYTVLVNYLQYTNNETDPVAVALRSPFLGRGPDRSILMGVEDSYSFDPSASFVSGNGSGQRGTLEAGNIAIVNVAGDKFFDVLCRDASDGNDVWKTAAFTALDALSVLMRREKNNRVLQYMVRRNFLRHFVDMVKKDDEELQQVLQPDPESLNALYVYESKMSLFLRISQRRDGAEKLLENGVIEILAQSQFLDQRPEIDMSLTGVDTFLPPATERYHQLLLPALQLIVGILATMGHENTSVLNRVRH